MKKRTYSEPGDRYDKALETELDKSPCTEKAGQPLDLDPASLPPCSPEIISDGKPCILQNKPYRQIFFPGHKAPEEKPENVKWGKEEKKPEEKPNKTEWGREDE